MDRRRRVVRSERGGLLGQRQRLIVPAQREQRARQRPQCGVFIGLGDERTAEIKDRVVRPVGIEQEAARMQGELAMLGGQIARPHRMRDRAVERAAGRQRAARVAMPLDPTGRQVDEALVDQRSLVVAAAVTEQPGAEPRCLGVVAGGKGQRAPAAFERLFPPPAMEQHLGEPAIQRRAVRPRIVVTPQQVETNVPLSRVQRMAWNAGPRKYLHIEGSVENCIYDNLMRCITGGS